MNVGLNDLAGRVSHVGELLRKLIGSKKMNTRFGISSLHDNGEQSSLIPYFADHRNSITVLFEFLGRIIRFQPKVRSKPSCLRSTTDIDKALNLERSEPTLPSLGHLLPRLHVVKSRISFAVVLHEPDSEGRIVDAVLGRRDFGETIF